MVLAELDFAGISKALDDVGVPMVAGVAQDNWSGSAALMTVPPGHCFIITKVIGQAFTQAAVFDGSPNLSAAADLDGITLNDTAGTAQSSALFRVFRRWQTPFEQAATPTWRNSPPCGYVHWNPKWPICVPPGWTVQSGGVSEAGGFFAAYGYLLSQDHARTLGFSTSPSTTDANRDTGIISAASTNSAVEILAGRAGKHIQILDMVVRVQPEVPEVTNVLTIRQTNDRDIFNFANNNPNNMLHVECSPGIYLEEGQGIEILSTVTLTASVCISYRFVDPEDVPGDHWWACTLPQLATPATTVQGSAQTYRSVSTPVTCFYPRRAVTKTLPTQGFQHILRGFAFSLQKDTTVSTDVAFLRLSTGEGSVIGATGIASSGTTETGVPLMPALLVTQQNQALWGVIDGLNVACPKDTGGISVDMLVTGPVFATTPTTTDADLDEVWVTCWGKTIPARFHGQINRGGA